MTELKTDMMIKAGAIAKCSRCEEWCDLVIINNQPVHTLILTEVVFTTKPTYQYSAWNLCKECVEKLNAWLENKPPED